MKSIELLSPAGDMDCLKTAFLFGADAVYLGGPFMQLRASSAGFDRSALTEAVAYAHAIGKKVYVTVNCFAKNDEINMLGDYAKFLYDIGTDAVIVSDIGAVASIKEASPSLEVHISTQANCTNYKSCEVYYNMGASRVVLARELSLEEIAFIAAKKPAGLELEAFIHGAMCMSYSGRCLISSFLTGRSGNRGECTQPCRWSYYLKEKNRPDEMFDITEEDGATAILSSHDLCCIDIIDEIISAGVTSLKIEGRMKTPYYVATVVNAYRAAIDKTVKTDILREELEKISHRPYAQGFYFGELKKKCFNDGQYRQSAKYAADVISSDGKTAVVRQRNNFKCGDTLEAVTPGVFGQSFAVTEIINEKGESQPDAPHPMQIIKINCPLNLKEGDILRLVLNKEKPQEGNL